MSGLHPRKAQESTTKETYCPLCKQEEESESVNHQLIFLAFHTMRLVSKFSELPLVQGSKDKGGTNSLVSLTDKCRFDTYLLSIGCPAKDFRKLNL